MKILVTDDEKLQRDSLAAILSDVGHQLKTAQSVQDAKDLLRESSFDLLISDFKMPDGTGLQLAEYAKSIAPDMGIFIMTAFADVQSVIEAMRIGVLDYFLKPLNVETFLRKIKFFDEHKALQREIEMLRSRLERQQPSLLLGESGEIQAVKDVIAKVAQTRGTVLITGESGTGKEVAARMIHASSQDKARKFIAINCAAIPENLIESELFGHKKGTFTGAVADKDGLFKVASGGTLFLDEIGELPKQLQAKLLRAIQEREATPLGDTKPYKFDLRLVVATNRDLETEVKNGQFRQDLFYRINVVQVTMPPLRDHLDDIPILVNFFLDKYSKQFQKPLMQFSGESLRCLRQYSWPGNIRELENVVERSVILSPLDHLIHREHLPAHIQLTAGNNADGPSFDDFMKLDVALADYARKHIQKILELSNGDKKEAAKKLGLGLSSLYRKMDELGIAVKASV
jgi:two-component system, NtrC family, response regulator AtoC